MVEGWGIGLFMEDSEKAKQRVPRTDEVFNILKNAKTSPETREMVVRLLDATAIESYDRDSEEHKEIFKGWAFSEAIEDMEQAEANKTKSKGISKAKGQSKEKGQGKAKRPDGETSPKHAFWLRTLAAILNNNKEVFASSFAVDEAYKLKHDTDFCINLTFAYEDIHRAHVFLIWWHGQIAKLMGSDKHEFSSLDEIDGPLKSTGLQSIAGMPDKPLYCVHYFSKSASGDPTVPPPEHDDDPEALLREAERDRRVKRRRQQLEKQVSFAKERERDKALGQAETDAERHAILSGLAGEPGVEPEQLEEDEIKHTTTTFELDEHNNICVQHQDQTEVTLTNAPPLNNTERREILAMLAERAHVLHDSFNTGDEDVVQKCIERLKEINQSGDASMEDIALAGVMDGLHEDENKKFFDKVRELVQKSTVADYDPRDKPEDGDHYSAAQIKEANSAIEDKANAKGVDPKQWKRFTKIVRSTLYQQRERDVCDINVNPMSLQEALEQLDKPATKEDWDAGSGRARKMPQYSNLDELVYTGLVETRPMPHQVVGAAWMIAQEEGPLKASIVADQAGSGKTYQTLYQICEAAAKMEKAWWKASKQEREEMDLRPTIIIVPNQVAKNWREEFRRFEGAIEFRTLPLHQTEFGDVGVKQYALPADTDDAIRALIKWAPVNNVKSLRKILLCTYDMFHRRFCKVTTKEAQAYEDRYYEVPPGAKSKFHPPEQMHCPDCLPHAPRAYDQRGQKTWTAFCVENPPQHFCPTELTSE